MQFQVEPWSAVLPELRPLFHMLWADVAIDKDKFTAKCNEAVYAELEKKGMLLVVTARSDGKIAGYFVILLNVNPHYEGAGLFAYTDMYFLLPEFRRGNTGLRLFAFMEERLREKGIVKAYTSHKIHRDRSAMLKVLGWTPSDVIYSKCLQ